jgi:hypothetical protein
VRTASIALIHIHDFVFPNYHYLRFELRADTLAGEMIRYGQGEAAEPGQWQIKDRFEITLPP